MARNKSSDVSCIADKNDICQLCKFAAEDDVKYGLKMKCGAIVAHYYCLVSVFWGN